MLNIVHSMLYKATRVFPEPDLRDSWLWKKFENCNLGTCSFPSFHILILTRCGVLEIAVLNVMSDLIYWNYIKINLWCSKQSTLTQSRVFHRRHMVSMIQSAVTSLHQKQTFFCHDNTVWLQNKTIVCQHSSRHAQMEKLPSVSRKLYGNQIHLLWNDLSRKNYPYESASILSDMEH